ncbi:hypothetical protein TNCV_1238371 [Trichonephila clavipes]|nr:hypothetical protein TNCV_1238371 [Trichonephila clavipes]
MIGRNRARKTWQFTRDPSDKRVLNNIQNRLHRKVKAFQNKIWEDELLALDPDDGSLWEMSKELRKKKSPVYALKGQAGIAHTDFDKAERRRRKHLFPEGREKKIDHDVRLDLIKKIPIKNGDGGRTPKYETLYRSRAPVGRGEERRKESGTAEGSESNAAIYHPKTQSKRRSAVKLNRVVKGVERVFFVELWEAERVSPPPVCCAVTPVTSVIWNANSVHRTKIRFLYYGYPDYVRVIIHNTFF